MAMDGLHFEWDRRKEAANRKKHGVSFEEARTAFFDENARFMADSEEEDRFVLLGLSSRLRLLISARKADRSERREYEGFRNA